MMMTVTQMNAYVQKFGRAYEKFLTPLAKQIDMPVKAVGILLYIANNPLANTAKDICRNLFMKQGIVSFHVDNLVKAGYLERQAARGDRRVTKLVCTDKSRPIISRGRELQKTFFENLTRGVSHENMEILKNCFDIFEKNISAMTERKKKDEEI